MPAKSYRVSSVVSLLVAYRALLIPFVLLALEKSWLVCEGFTVRFKMVSVHSEEPVTCATFCLSQLSPTLPLKQCSSDLRWWPFLWRKITEHFLSLRLEGRSPSASSVYACLLQTIDGVMFVALCPLVVSQVPQHLRYSETGAICVVCLSC